MAKVIPTGPFHPILEEPEFFKFHVDGETITKIDIRIGYSHRGIELLSEDKTWDQVPFLVERICGICSYSHPYGYCLAVERLANCEIPDRAKYIRAIVAELERLHSHLLWMGLAGHFIGYNTVFMWVWKWRELVLDALELTTGNRNHYANIKPGGVRRDIEDYMIPKLEKWIDELEPKCEMLIKVVMDDPVLHARLKGVGVLTKQEAIDYCALGPTARASGVAIDARADHPFDAYPLLDWKVISLPDGDVFAKAAVRLLENLESIKIIRQAIKKLKPGPIVNEIKEVPVGEAIGLYEAPRGETFHYIRSDGSNMPIRHKVRAPSYMNILTNELSCVGADLADGGLITAAHDPCYSCTERLSAVNDSIPENVLNSKEIARLSREKTKSIAEKFQLESNVTTDKK
ncbi:MAG: nickel-dependent hydrogenase large subunit [Acidobacteria bacterium]|nr:nickel-dependent hydrogenase large subunit [Acidobacteriota bacterium]